QDGAQVTVTLADLDLTPADALSLTRSDLERLAAELGPASTGAVAGGSAGDRYEQAADLVALIGRRPATRRTFSESPTPDPPAAFLEAVAALVSPTGQLGITAAFSAADLPSLRRAPALDDEYLPVAAAVRPALARLEAHQLATGQPLTAWANRPDDLWQTDAQDGRPLVVVHADPALDLASPPGLVAAAALDRFEEVIPAAEQRTGAAFGFDAPAARPQQAI